MLPRQGQLGAPLTTVNTAKVADRRLSRSATAICSPQTARDDFLKPITPSRAGEIESQDGVKVWSGSMDVASELNKDVVTDFPLVQAVGKLQPGVYLVTARPWKGDKAPSDDSGEDDYTPARDAMDGRLRPRPHHVFGRRRRCTRSCARWPAPPPLAGVEVRLVARNNEVLAVKTTGADGRVDFDPGLSRGDGRLGAGPARRDARRRLRLPQSRRSPPSI